MDRRFERNVFLVIEKRGYVQTIQAVAESLDGSLAGVPPDPSGVRLGDTAESAKRVHADFHSETSADGTVELIGRSGDFGVGYEFKDGLLRSYLWSQPVSGDTPEQPPLTLPAGDSPATAILDVQKNESSGVDWEYMYLAFHPCDGETRWKTQQQALFHADGHAYDRLHVVCPTTKAAREFYFNIDAYLGKL